MDRRAFLRLLGLAAAAPIVAELDIERLLWVPRQMIVVPAMPSRGLFDLRMASDILKEIYLPVIRAQLNNSTILLKHFEEGMT